MLVQSTKSTGDRFSPHVEEVLRKSDWHPERAVSDEQIENWLVIEWKTEPGFHYQTRMFSAALRILREFGGLIIKTPVDYMFSHLIFDPLVAVKHIQRYNWPLNEWLADGSLYPIAYHDTGTTDNSAVAVTGQGQLILLEFDKLLGSNINEAIQNVVNGTGNLKDWDVDQEKFNEATTMFPLMRKKLGVDTM